MRIQVMCCSLWVGMLAIRLVLLALSFYLLLAGAKTAEKLCGGSIFFALLTCLSGFTRFAGALLPIWIVVKGSIIFSAFLFPERINQVIDECLRGFSLPCGKACQRLVGFFRDC